MLRQGDIWIEDVSEVPADAVRVQPASGRYVVAEGEATGHAHTIDATPEVEMYELGGVLYCRIVGSGVKIKHEEHIKWYDVFGNGIVEPVLRGIKRVVRQRVWDSANAARIVTD